MARSIVIPDDQVVALRDIISLPAPSFEGLVGALRAPYESVDRDDIVRRVVETTQVGSEDASALVTALIQAHGVKSQLGTGPDAVAAMVADAVHPEAAEHDRVVERLTTLLELPELARIAKALYMLVEHERVYHSARVITDVRAVFDDDVSNGPKGAVLVHILKIDYHEDDEEKSFFVGLDTEDVSDLRRVLDRADKKAGELRALLGTTSVPILEVGKEED